MKVFLDFAAPTTQGQRVRAAWGEPLRVLQAHQPAEVLPVLAAVQAAAQAGQWCVGCVRYEAAPAFDRALEVHAADGPLAWFGVFNAPEPEGLGAAPTTLDAGWSGAHAAEVGVAAIAQWDDGMPRPAFDTAMAEIHHAIAEGRYYQLNFTHALQGRLTQGTPWSLFQALRRAQPGGYAAYVDTGEEQVLSVSPELFFDWDGTHLLTRPMKGTAPRGATPAADRDRADALHHSPKERAENVMIVDLLRNDLSRIAEPHTVQVPRLFHREPLPSVWQMTSDVTASTRPGTTLADVFRALFPCGSITGAPKVEAMRHIRALEPGPRGPYCGAVGVVRPGARPGTVAATFNVAIRTVVARPTAEGVALRCGIGSGITADARPDAEWQEWRHKRAFLERASQPFDLLETLGLHDGMVRHVEQHLARMAGAAAHFGYPWQPDLAEQALAEVAQQHPVGAWRLRLLCNAQGQVSVQAFAMAPTPEPVTLALADRAFEAADSEFVRFKTTRRAHYEAFEPRQPGVFDNVLWNRDGELTECTRGNIALLIDGRWLTPPVSVGLLDGVGRQHWLAQGRLHEAMLSVEDLQRAQGLAFINSLRGWLDARLLA